MFNIGDIVRNKPKNDGSISYPAWAGVVTEIKTFSDNETFYLVKWDPKFNAREAFTEAANNLEKLGGSEKDVSRLRNLAENAIDGIWHSPLFIEKAPDNMVVGFNK